MSMKKFFQEILYLELLFSEICHITYVQGKSGQELVG